MGSVTDKQVDKRLDKRVVAYSAAVAAAGLATGGTARAAIIANTTPTTVAQNTSVNVDFNGDGTTDISFTNQTAAKNSNNRYYVNGGTYATSPFPADADRPVRPTAFTAGQVIGPALTFGMDTGDQSNTLAGNNNTSSPPGVVAGLFAQDGSTVNYLGVSFLVGTQTDYGWLGLVLNPTANGGTTNTITGYAYDDTGAAIPAGATSSTGVPEPASLSALAIGAAAMVRRRRPAGA